MEWLDEAELYLRLRIQSKATDVTRLLNRWVNHKLHLRTILEMAVEIIDSRRDEEGMSVFVSTASEIGKEFLSYCSTNMRIDNVIYVKVGALIVESLYRHGEGEIDFKRPAQYSSEAVAIIPKWETATTPADKSMRGLYSTPPGKLDLIQKVQWKDGPIRRVSLIKRWDETDRNVYESYKNEKCFKAAEKLANVGWNINEKVYEAILKHDFKFDNKSKEIEYKYTMEYAKNLLGETFYYSPEFDYRGRLYFTTPFLNFQGADLARGLLQFSKGKVVNEGGLAWMKRHCAASYNQSYHKNDIPEWCTADYKSHLEAEGLEDISVDKMTLHDRELWVDNHMEMIRDVANNLLIVPCEKPISFLAVALELVACEKSKWHFSHLPIPIDGSNNGWQHLGAISKDSLTGKLVGLTPVDIQQDFYVQTAKELISITRKERQRDILESMPMKHIRKGISKRGSMTRAYSAGAQKIAVNMYDDCKKEKFHKKYGITEADCKVFARDLVTAIEHTCPGPLRTMSYLQKLCEHWLESGHDDIAWVTPAGFPVFYRCTYQDPKTKHISMPGYSTYVDKHGVTQPSNQIRCKIMVVTDKPDRRGYMCGISPNFIHSQDAAHMCDVILTHEGDFGAVHDSFSSHARDVDDLLEITKESFIEMYDYENYFDIIEEQLSPNSGVEQPTLGTLNIKEIINGDYFFA